jgi:hypothetical protein
MAFTNQFAAQTPKPSEAMTVEKRTSVATNAFKFGPSQCSFKYAFYSNLGVVTQASPRLLSYSSRVDAGSY